MCQESKEDFAQAIGYDQLKKLLTHAFGDYLARDAHLASELLGVLFDMLVDGPFDPSTYFLIQVGFLFFEIMSCTIFTRDLFIIFFLTC